VRQAARAALASGVALLGAPALGAGALDAPAQEPEPERDPELLELHRLALELERRLAVQQAWLAADEEPRRAAADVIHAQLRTGIPTVYWPPLAVLADAWNVLRGADLEQDGPERRFAAALDLRVRPGAFAAQEGSDPAEQGAPLTIDVEALYSVELPGSPESPDSPDSPDSVGEARLSLFWIGPDGTEIRARSEPILEPEAFAAPGFPMYVRAPLAEPGLWSLVPEIETARGAARGFPVRVECVEALEQRLAELQALLAAEAPADERTAAELLRALRAGVRSPLWPRLVEHFEGRHASLWRDYEMSGIELGGAELVGIPPSEDARAVLIVLAASGKPAAWTFAGPAGEAWRRLAIERRVLVLATDLPIDSAGVAAGAATVSDLAAGLRAAEPDRPVLLLASGPALSRLRSAERRGAELAFDGLVLSTVLARPARPRGLDGVPTLFVEVLADAPSESGPEGDELTWMRRPEPPLVADVMLPDWIGPWLEAR